MRWKMSLNTKHRNAKLRRTACSSEGELMTVERALRLIAGTFILLSLALGHYVSPYWYLFTAFVGLNLFQSGFTNWCPMMTFLRKLEVGR
jgi:hypothetical protein